VTVTGTIRLAGETGLPAFRWASAIGYLALLGAWLLVFVRTLMAARRGTILQAPAPESTRPPAFKTPRTQNSPV
jgi:tellurite resistance protein TehA-like permease